MQAQQLRFPSRHHRTLQTPIPAIVIKPAEDARARLDPLPNRAVKGVTHVGHPVRKEVVPVQASVVMSPVARTKAHGNAVGAARVLYFYEDLGGGEPPKRFENRVTGTRTVRK
jgi:hypothetical protein